MTDRIGADNVLGASRGDGHTDRWVVGRGGSGDGAVDLLLGVQSDPMLPVLGVQAEEVAEGRQEGVLACD